MTEKRQILSTIILIIVCITIAALVFYFVVTNTPQLPPQSEQYPGVITDKWITQRNGYDYYYFAINDYYLMQVSHIKYNQYEIGDNINFTMEQVRGLE